MSTNRQALRCPTLFGSDFKTVKKQFFENYCGKIIFKEPYKWTNKKGITYFFNKNKGIFLLIDDFHLQKYISDYFKSKYIMQWRKYYFWPILDAANNTFIYTLNVVSKINGTSTWKGARFCLWFECSHRMYQCGFISHAPVFG